MVASSRRSNRKQSSLFRFTRASPFLSHPYIEPLRVRFLRFVSRQLARDANGGEFAPHVRIDFRSQKARVPSFRFVSLIHHYLRAISCIVSLMLVVNRIDESVIFDSLNLILSDRCIFDPRARFIIQLLRSTIKLSSLAINAFANVWTSGCSSSDTEGSNAQRTSTNSEEVVN